MKTSRLRAGAAGAALALTAGFAAAADTVNSGYVGGELGYFDLEAGGESEDATTYGVEGAWATPLGGPNLGLQLDGSWRNADFDTGEIETIAGAAHIFLRDSDSHAFGGFVDLRNIDISDDGSTVDGGDVEAATIGAEGALMRGGFALEGEFGYVNLDAGEGADADGFGGAVGFTFYPNETVGYGANIGTLQIDDGDTDISVTSIAADLEMQIPNTAFSGYAEVSFTDTDLGGGADVESTAIMFGLRFSGGVATPAERQAYGASFNGADRFVKLF